MSPVLGEFHLKAHGLLQAYSRTNRILNSVKTYGNVVSFRNLEQATNDALALFGNRDARGIVLLKPYAEYHAEYRSASETERERINDDVVFEIELIKQVEVNVDYILMLVEAYLKTKGSGRDREVRANIERAIDSCPSLRNKKDLIEQFVDSVSTRGRVDTQWQDFVLARKAGELERIIEEENLNAAETRAFIENAFRDGAIPTAGTAVTRILPPASRFSRDNDHGRKKQSGRCRDRLAAFFDRYARLASS